MRDAGACQRHPQIRRDYLINLRNLWILAGGAFGAGAVAILAIVERDALGEGVAMDPKDDRRF